MHLTPLVGSKVHYFDFCVTPLLVSNIDTFNYLDPTGGVNIDTFNYLDPAGGVKKEAFPFINLTPPAGSSKSEVSSFPPVFAPTSGVTQ